MWFQDSSMRSTDPGLSGHVRGGGEDIVVAEVERGLGVALRGRDDGHSEGVQRAVRAQQLPRGRRVRLRRDADQT